MPAQKSVRVRRWCFTAFRDLESFAEGGDVYTSASEDCSRGAWQEEKSPSTGKLHIQGYLVFKTNVRLATVKRLVGETAHCEVSKGSDLENLTYCSKGDTSTGRYKVKFGDFSGCGSGQGKRVDLASGLNGAIQEVKDGRSIQDIASNFSEVFVKHHRGLIALKQAILDCPSQFDRTCIAIWGTSGTGKSLWARVFSEHRSLRIYSKPPGKDSMPQWFDGYDGEEVLLLDDFEPSQVPFRELLVWLDVYKHRIQVKGGMVLGMWKTVIITSNVDPHDWYVSDKFSRADRSPLDRRLDHILQAPVDGRFCTSAFDPKLEYKGRSACAPFVAPLPAAPVVEAVVSRVDPVVVSPLPPMRMLSPPVLRRDRALGNWRAVSPIRLDALDEIPSVADACAHPTLQPCVPSSNFSSFFNNGVFTRLR